MKGDVHIPNNMLTGGHHIPPQFLQIHKDDKFFSRLLSKESSKAESSFRVLYYGRTAGSIPFMWESQPGTPKHPFSDNSVPPLTPPPSYQFIPRMETMRRKNSKSNFLDSIFPRRNSKRSDKSKSASFSSSGSSSFSLPSTPPMNKYTSRKINGMPRSMSAIHFGHDDDDDHEQVANSPTSTLCFGAGIKRGGKFGTRTHPMKNVIKKAFLSIVGHGTA